MSIVFEPYRNGTGHAVLPGLRSTGREVKDSGLARVWEDGAGHGTQINLGTGSATVSLRTLSFPATSTFAGVGHAIVQLTTLGDDVQGSMPKPNIALGSATLVVGALGAGTQTNHGQGTAKLTATTWARDVDAVGRATLPLTVWGSGVGMDGAGRTATLLQHTGFYAHGVQGDTLQVAQALSLAQQAWTQWSFDRRETLVLQGGSRDLLDGLAAAHARLALAETVGVILPVLVSEGFAVADDASAWAEALLQTVDALALAAGAGSLLGARQSVAQAMVLIDAATRAWPASIHDVLGVAEVSRHGLHGGNTLLDVLRLHSVAPSHASMVALVDDTLPLADSSSSVGDLLTRIRDGLRVLATFRLPDGTVYTAWVLNGDTRAFTTYSNFPFNSFCELDGHYYGATDTGLYLLEGDDDDGVPIDARVRGGLSDMGTGLLKRMESLYLGYRADGGLLLKVVTTSDGGEKREDWYALAAQPADAVREGRIKIGRGLKSRYWGFELANVDGGDFALDSVAWLPMILERRI